MNHASTARTLWTEVCGHAAVTGIAKHHGGGYGLGIIYAEEMFGAQEGR